MLEDALCGCPREDTGYGITKVHNSKCKAKKKK